MQTPSRLTKCTVSTAGLCWWKSLYWPPVCSPRPQRMIQRQAPHNSDNTALLMTRPFPSTLTTPKHATPVVMSVGCALKSLKSPGPPGRFSPLSLYL